MASSVTSANASVETVMNGELIDLPYHLLQKLSITLLGLTPFAIKLPSIILGVLLAVLLILLLNRWFKNNVAILASVLTVLSPPFLYLAGSGTPVIMFVFWPALLLWLGSKIQGSPEKTTSRKARIPLSFLFGVVLLLSAFTPHLIYLAAFIFLYVIFHPHLRYTLKTLPKVPFAIVSLVVIGALGFLVFSIIRNNDTLDAILLSSATDFGGFFNNIKDGFLPFFSWSGSVESTMLSPMIGLATLFLAFIGLISTARGFFASRNSIASMLIIFTVFITGLDPASAILIILPLSILTAHGVRYILEKWYNLFPENPYARFFGLLPIGTLMALLIIPSLTYYIFGYRYNPAVADEFINDLDLIHERLEPGTNLYIKDAESLEYQFYAILDDFNVAAKTADFTSDKPVATLGRLEENLKNYTLNRIYTSPKSTKSDRIYVYVKK